ncbi:MAG TPA: IclR family transcriptional regulator C-terminal domain-containing protein [Acidimicrobiales bacterium]|nr:IclR family transcriptional regulator C-terminal domain-containing protein [Acidimicrobiales bacterium]
MSRTARRRWRRHLRARPHGAGTICAETELLRYTSHTITETDRLLEDLAGVRQRGCAIDDEEEVYGVFCVGAPFFDHSGACAGAISVTGIKQDLPDWRLAEPGRLIRRIADQASALPGGPLFDAVPSTMGIQPQPADIARVAEPVRCTAGATRNSPQTHLSRLTSSAIEVVASASEHAQA